MLYSLNNTYPTSIPQRIRLSSGQTRTDPTTFTDSELEDAGYKLVPLKPVTEDRTKTVEWNSLNAEWIVRDKTQFEIDAENARQWKLIREQRNEILTKSDWSQTLDVIAQMTFDQKDQWRNYRQALRDITLQSDPFNIQWPSLPTWEALSGL